MNLSGQAAEERRSQGTPTPPPEGSANGATPAPHTNNRSAKDLAETLQRIIEHAAALLEARNCSLAVMEPASSTLVTIASLYPDAKTARRPRFKLNEGVAGWVAANLTPAIVENVATDPRFKETGSSYPISSMLCAPLLSGQQLLGTITVSSPTPGAFTEESLRLLEVFAEQAVFAITKARQMEEALLHTGQLAALLDVSRAMTSTLDARQIFRAIVAGLRRLVRCDDAMIFAYDEATQELGVVAVMGLRSARLRDTRIPLSDPQSLAAWVAQKRRPVLHAPGERGGMGQITEAFLAGDDLALLAVPLLSKERLRGVVTLARATPFDSNDLRAMMNLSSIIATALENAGLYQAVKAEQERLAAIFASSSDGIALIDMNQRVVEANQSFYAILQQQGQGQLLCRQVLHCDHQGGHTLCREGCMILSALQRRKVVPIAEIEFFPPSTRTSGSITPGTLQKHQAALSITPVLADQGYQALVIARDTTPLREMDRMKANFISMVSHELRSPLNAINGYLDLALEGVGGELSERLHEFIRRARSSSEHLTALVDDLLLISRADAGQFRLNIGPAHAQKIIKEALEEVELLAADAHIQLAVRVAPDLPPFAGDEMRLKQVVRNLLTNAIKFTPKGGRIMVSADLRTKGVEIAVQDSGRGISPEHLPRIFDRFYQVARGQGAGRGQGLGLAIVKTIIERHHGSISVESVPGEGSTFMILLPPGPTQAGNPYQRQGQSEQEPALGSKPPEASDAAFVRKITHPVD
jgi:signal transduction histidine kinase